MQGKFHVLEATSRPEAHWLYLSSTPFVVAGQRETSRQLIDKSPALKGQGWGAAGSFNQDHMVTGGLCMLRHAGEDLHGAKNGVAG